MRRRVRSTKVVDGKRFSEIVYRVRSRGKSCVIDVIDSPSLGKREVRINRAARCSTEIKTRDTLLIERETSPAKNRALHPMRAHINVRPVDTSTLLLVLPVTQEELQDTPEKFNAVPETLHVIALRKLRGFAETRDKAFFPPSTNHFEHCYNVHYHRGILKLTFLLRNLPGRFFRNQHYRQRRNG